MSGRLASFRGPSTPTASPVQNQQPSSPASPSRTTESTYHRRTRLLLQELRACTITWDDLVLVDGLKAAKSLVDNRTELDNALALIPAGKQPNHRLVGPRISIMEKRISELDIVVSKLKKQFQRMNTLVDTMESILYEAQKAKGWRWAQEEPLWTTWTLEKFVSTLPQILKPYHRSLTMHIEIVSTLRPHTVSFETSRDALERWQSQPWLETGSWDETWEEICSVEIDRWE
ncbi:hypothetical protein JAAARDRAFT_123903 [Jaapia argillacea MUCL 33604]|uniref:Uncharacterized protein n=1 Tax=Jaapia argillacea MUCL 33604 TaxID=933084 RepID=A0A067Q0Y5_9AGAM|nr:hypothetical protein JAAARDRAFT_123903 [Jaapia argillacea MUCL 33604]